MSTTYRIGEDLSKLKLWTVKNLKEGPPQSVMHGGFPSEPAKHCDSHRVTNMTSNPEV